MTARERLRRQARRWVGALSFPGKRALLVELHRLPAARLAVFSRLLIPAANEEQHDVVEPVRGTRLEVDLRSAAQRAIAYRLSDVQELALIGELVRPGMLAVDAGANIGLFTTALARAVGPDGAVHAFEPNPATADQLERNVGLNRLGNVRVNRTALSASVGFATLRSPVAEEPGLASITHGGEKVAEVPTVPLDDYASEAGIERVDFLKLDVEGAELDVLEGATTLLDRGLIDRVLFEVLDGSHTVQEHLAERGFTLWAVTPPGRQPLVRPTTTDETFAYANLLAVAPGVQTPA